MKVVRRFWLTCICGLGVVKYRGDWGWEKQKRVSELVLIYLGSSCTKYRFYTMVPLRLLIWLVASISTGMWLLRMAAHWGRSIVFPFHVIKGWLCIAAHWGRSFVLPFHVIKRWLGFAVHGYVLRPFYCSPFPCDKTMTVFCCAWLCIEVALLFSFPMWLLDDKLVRWFGLFLFASLFIFVCYLGV